MSEMQVEAPGPRRRIRDPQRTRAAIVAALLDCLREGEMPTARRIAVRAQVSERSIFVHFDDLDDLRGAAAQSQHDAVVAAIEPIDAGLALDRRISELVRQRERIFPLQALRIMALDEATRSDLVAAAMARSDAALTAQVEQVFAAELRSAGSRSERSELLGALDATAGWPFRHHLCATLGRSPAQASRTVARALKALLADGGDRKPRIMQ